MKEISKTRQEIIRLVKKCPWSSSKELFRSELEYLVALAEKEQMVKDYKSAMGILRGKK